MLSNGIDPSVRHSDAGVVIQSESGEEASVPLAEWARAVVGFADQVKAFYDASPPKVIPDQAEERAGWAAFWREWGVRRRAYDARA